VSNDEVYVLVNLFRSYCLSDHIVKNNIDKNCFSLHRYNRWNYQRDTQTVRGTKRACECLTGFGLPFWSTHCHVMLFVCTNGWL